MPDPVDIDMSTIAQGPWPAFTISGATGTGASGVNAAYFLQPGNGTPYQWMSAAGATVTGSAAGLDWAIESSSTEYFTSATGHRWPWLATWTPDNGAAGTLAFAEGLAPPVTVEAEGAEAVAQATLTTALAGTHNDIVFTAIPAGRLGNGIRVRYVDPAANSQALSVSVSGRDITVNLATNSGGAITSTVATIGTALEVIPAVLELITAALAPGNNGTGVVTAMPYTALAGGTGGLPPAPTAVTI